jgi:hypothetical protein
MPADAWKEWYAVLRPLSSVRFWFAAWQERTAEILKIIEAFSKANEYWEVGFAVNASNLGAVVSVSESIVHG